MATELSLSAKVSFSCRVFGSNELTASESFAEIYTFIDDKNQTIRFAPRDHSLEEMSSCQMHLYKGPTN